MKRPSDTYLVDEISRGESESATERADERNSSKFLERFSFLCPDPPFFSARNDSLVQGETFEHPPTNGAGTTGIYDNE